MAPHRSLAALAALLLATISASNVAVAAPAPPGPQTNTEEVRIPSEPGVVLAGTLHLPARKGPYSILILQTGSGLQKRGSYLSLQQRLNDAGIATIDFDKRGTGQSTGIFTDTMQDMEADLAATIKWLRMRGDIDGKRIAILGHSQGAAAAPIVADRDGGLAAIVFLAGPVGESGTIFLDFMRDHLVESGHSADATNRVVSATRAWMEARRHGAPGTEIAQGRRAVVSAFVRAGFDPNAAEATTKTIDTAQVLSMYEAATGPALKRLRIPVLAVLAGRDQSPDANAAAATAALAENPDALVVQVPGAGHLFVYRPADAPPNVTPPGGRWLFPETLIAHWLIERLAPDGGNGAQR
ncbi:alpha/beta fold hydrolase [Sphingomonas sp. KR3-1]|uniref:alpha/beta hydrolase n=1 Tax=Sphingomonas sp. KR3-1 TaxID=3156611 RepID=UPI0032B62518